MREILFRGKKLGTNKWIYGDFKREANLCYIEERYIEYYEKAMVIPETVGQHTCLPFDIYEGDIIESYLHPNAIYVVLWNEHQCCFSAIDKYEYDLYSDELFKYNSLNNKRNITPDWILKFQFGVIGNIHDNPELMKEK
ncbi:hypothetical protein D0T49_04350 [Paludibacter sp. 221]|uniref:YopX family protein n=1 Tax=Paludibacter sp. 221 TaxID=2302939 RepID=UPI0013D6A43B|nr:YopX family protein [Paludibacter sp. 221]NDV46270.1 hypothetical protein [Paludibacter sp. 221]